MIDAILLSIGIVLTLGALLYTSYMAARDDAEDEADPFR
jgi:hypothetical protein